jgi:hypothetical protein
MVDHAQIVVGTRVGRIDPAGEGSENGEVAFGKRRRRHGSGQANGVKDGLEGRQVWQQQEMTPEPLFCLDLKLGLDAEDEIALVPKIEIRRGQHGRPGPPPGSDRGSSRSP